MTPFHVHLLPDPEAVVEVLAERYGHIAHEAVTSGGEFRVALAGGGTPAALYRRLARPEWQQRLPWTATRVFFGDERWVPLDHPDRNARMAHEALLDHVPIPADHIHPIPTTGYTDPEASAAGYTETLKALACPAGEAWPRFDLVLLGLGTDGHIASLFPGHPALEETDRWVVGVSGGAERQTPRVSLTRPVLAAARYCIVLVTGAAKATVVREALTMGASGDRPIHRLMREADTEWFIDAAAGGFGDPVDYPAGS